MKYFGVGWLTFTLSFNLILFLVFLSNSTSAQNCSTPSTRSSPTVLLGSGYTNSGDGATWYLGPTYTKSFYMNSNTFFVIENVTSGRSIRISTCGSGYDSQITLRDWSTDTFLAYNNDDGPACSGSSASLDYSGNSSYPHVKVILNQYNCGATSNSTLIYVTFLSENNIPSNPTSVTATYNYICNGASTQLTAAGAVGTVYWYTGSCGGTQVTTGNPVTVSPTGNTTYYARNYSNSQYSAGCASVDIVVNARPTVNDLVATGNDIKWYLTETGGTALATSTQLLNNTYYWASQTVNGVESTARFRVLVTMTNP